MSLPQLPLSIPHLPQLSLLPRLTPQSEHTILPTPPLRQFRQLLQEQALALLLLPVRELQSLQEEMPPLPLLPAQALQVLPRVRLLALLLLQ